MRLKGKTAVITGAGSGFGAEIARKFSREGAEILAVDINEESARKIAEETQGKSCVADVSSDSSVKGMLEAAVSAFGEIDILVNNAGITHLPGPLEDITEEDFDRVFAVNSKSVYLTARHFVPRMKSRKSGNIVNIASTAGITPRPNLNWYNASKGWMITATKAMAIELASYKVRVNAVCPVAGETPLLKSFMGGDTPELRRQFSSVIPLGRLSTPDDVACAACYLASDEAAMVTGTALAVDGGRAI